MAPENLLVTGGAGFIGSNFVRYWHRHYPHCRLIVLDALTYAGRKANLGALLEHPKIEFVQGDICDRARVDHILKTYAIDTLVHFAAESHVDRSIQGPAAFVQTNIVGTFTLLEAFCAHWRTLGHPTQARFLHVSTDEVYGSLGPLDPPFTETSPYAPSSPYSASKAGSDHLVRAYHRTYGLPTLIANASNNYGPYQFPEKFIPLMCLNILLGKPLPIYGDGQNIRDWLFVEDHCRALDAVLHRAHPGATYNIGGQSEIKNIDLVILLCDLMNELAPELPVRPAQELITFVRDRPGHDFRYATDISKLVANLGWQPSISLDQGLSKTASWYLSHSSWWTPLLSRETTVPSPPS
ncbi:dTDP-glucose 4,6-dehydratase [Nodosilinea nodulosa]|uniref:dTDP-glucose 4,6-dehydratase n=1 Tax=Nodosilinea nodulosa TaxID=416001 RepID=UPI00031E2DC4|nr:dTDP-glucose 4,6-dehydratase [Nodosilinea nodulosa]